MDEVAAWAIGAEADGVERAAGLCLVLWVAREVAQFVVAVSKLALLTILAGAVLLKGPAQLCLVAGGVDLRAGPGLHERILELLAAFAVGTVTVAVLLVCAGHHGTLLAAA